LTSKSRVSDRVAYLIETFARDETLSMYYEGDLPGEREPGRYPIMFALGYANVEESFR